MLFISVVLLPPKEKKINMAPSAGFGFLSLALVSKLIFNLFLADSWNFCAAPGDSKTFVDDARSFFS